MALSKSFLDEVRSFFAVPYVIPVGSGSTGLALVLEAVGARGKRVIIPALVCPNVAVAVYAVGAIPVVADVSMNDYNLAADSVAAAMTDDVAAIIAVSSFGYPTDIDALELLASERNCVVIDDACQAYGGFRAGRPMGGLGHVGIVSFGYAKPVELGGGGLILTASKTIADEIEVQMESLQYRILSGLKNRTVLKLMHKDRYQTITNWATRYGLLKYEFPCLQARQLPERWREWSAQVDDIRGLFSRAEELVGRLDGVELFDYQTQGWLPWRYSFKARDAAEADKVSKMLASAGIRTTRLYENVDRYIDVEQLVPTPGAAGLRGRTVNLATRTTLKDVTKLVERLEGLIRK